MKIIALMICCFILPQITFAEDVGSAKENVDKQLVVEMDLTKLRDPFLTQLPIVKQKIKKVVEPKDHKIDNMMPPIKKGVEVKPVPVMAPVLPPALRLQGIIWGETNPQAILNNSIVGVGDQIEGAEVKKISKNGIDVVFKGQSFHFQLE